MFHHSSHNFSFSGLPPTRGDRAPIESELASVSCVTLRREIVVGLTLSLFVTNSGLLACVTKFVRFCSSGELEFVSLKRLS